MLEKQKIADVQDGKQWENVRAVVVGLREVQWEAPERGANFGPRHCPRAQEKNFQA